MKKAVCLLIVALFVSGFSLFSSRFDESIQNCQKPTSEQKTIYLQMAHMAYMEYTPDNCKKIYKKLAEHNGFPAEGKSIQDITPLKDLTNYRDLLLDDNEIQEITAIEDLINLERIEFNKNKVESLLPLKKLTKLKYIEFDHNRIKLSQFEEYTVNPFEELKELEYLNLYDNQIQDIQWLGNLTNLKYLDLSHNQIKDISALANLTKLRSLKLWGNQIEDITVIKKLTWLRWIELSDNQIKDISVFEKPVWNNLEYISLERNSIEDISAFDHDGYAHVGSIHLSGNPIKDYTPLKNLKKRASGTFSEKTNTKADDDSSFSPILIFGILIVIIIVGILGKALFGNSSQNKRSNISTSYNVTKQEENTVFDTGSNYSRELRPREQTKEQWIAAREKEALENIERLEKEIHDQKQRQFPSEETIALMDRRIKYWEYELNNLEMKWENAYGWENPYENRS